MPTSAPAAIAARETTAASKKTTCIAVLSFLIALLLYFLGELVEVAAVEVRDIYHLAEFPVVLAFET